MDMFTSPSGSIKTVPSGGRTKQRFRQRVYLSESKSSFEHWVNIFCVGILGRAFLNCSLNRMMCCKFAANSCTLIAVCKSQFLSCSQLVLPHCWLSFLRRPRVSQRLRFGPLGFGTGEDKHSICICNLDIHGYTLMQEFSFPKLKSTL